MSENLFQGRRSTETRILIIGRTGWGKSATGNTILGREVFQTSKLPSSETPNLQREEGKRDGRKIVVVDTPGFFDTRRSFTQYDILRCVHLLHPGPHAIVLVIKVGKLTEEGKGTIKQVKKLFQKEGKKFLVVVFTHKDKLDEGGMSLKNFIDSGGAEFSDIIKMAGDRYLAFNNEADDNEKAAQVKTLLSMIDNLRYYTEEMYNSDWYSSVFASCTAL